MHNATGYILTIMASDIALLSLGTPLELERMKQMLKRKTELLEDFILNNSEQSLQ